MQPRKTGLTMLALLLCVIATAAAQERFGTLIGQVVDEQGAALPGATVTITNTQTGEARTIAADQQGALGYVTVNYLF